MGLDNGFVLRDTKNNTDIELFSFRNYHELARYFRVFDMLPNTKDDSIPSYEYLVTKERLTNLKVILQPAYDILATLPESTVDYYDDNGYPPKYCKLLYGKDFDPTSAGTCFAGAKLIRLYRRVEALLEIMDNLKDYHQIIFYDSY